MSEALWHSAALDDATTRWLAKSCKIPYKVARWLRLRGVETVEEAMDWLNPKQPWTDPLMFWDIGKATQRILRAIDARERIAIVGDYDVDGVTASAIMASTLNYLHADWVCIIPHRLHDGYGLSESIVERAAEAEADLIVTVDNGIRANEAVTYAVELGMDVIVTDHHEPGEQLPLDALAVVHWQRHDDQGSAKLLSGAGVAWKLSTLLLASQSASALRDQLMRTQLGLATLGAMADVMPVRGENRRLIRDGMRTLKTSTLPGWLALCKTAAVDPERLTDNAVLWKITPRLNSAGRMSSAEVAFQLLMADSDEEAMRLAQQIEALNDARRAETTRVVSEATEQWKANCPDGTESAVVVAGEWNLGVVGIVAARLVDTFGRPAIVLADTGDEVLRGSGRAPDGFSLHSALEQCTEFLHHFGGHDAAIGCGVSREMLEAFRLAFAEVAAGREQASASALNDEQAKEIADDYLPLREVSLETVDWIERLAPFGPGNPPLTLYVGPVEVVQVVPLQGGKHVRLKVKEGLDTADLVWFQAPAAVSSWSSGQMIGAVVSLEANEWQGVKRPQLLVQKAWQLKEPLTREIFAFVFRELRKHASLDRALLKEMAIERSIDDIDTILTAFVELGFAEWRDSAYHVNKEVVWRDLRDSESYQIHLRKHHVFDGP